MAAKITFAELIAKVGNQRLVRARKAHKRNLRRADNREALARFERAEKRFNHRNRDAE